MLKVIRSVLCLLLPCAAANAAPLGNVRVFFSPKGGCTAAVVEALGQATNSVQVQAYSFTSAPIAKALVEASRRGVKVQVLLDKSQRTQNYSSADFLRNSGVPTAIDAAHAIAHNKIMILDRGTVITGSFNFTGAAEQSNAENLLIIRDSDLANTYLGNWQIHQKHCIPYTGKSAPGGKAKPRSPKASTRGAVPPTLSPSRP